MGQWGHKVLMKWVDPWPHILTLGPRGRGQGQVRVDPFPSWHFMIMKFGKWMSKLHSLMDISKKSCIWCNQKVLSILKVLTKYASSSDPSMDWCKYLGVGIYAFISWSKHIFLYRSTCGEACIYKKVSGSTTAFLISICEWHIVDRKWCRIFWKA